MSKKTSKELTKWQTNHGAEILRFIIVGVICTIIDFAVSYFLRFAFTNNLSTTETGAYIATAICVAAGFIVSVIVNFFLSKGWVFQNVDKDYGKARYFWLYFGLSFLGLLLGIAIMAFGEWICDASFGFRYPLNPFADSIWGDLFAEGGAPFWAYVIIFIIKTLIVLIYNYLTRKFIIFKEPKAKKENVEEAINEAVIYNYTAETASYETTKKKEKVRTEIETVYCKPQFDWGKPINKAAAKRELYASLEIFDPRKTSVANTKRQKEIIVEEILKADAERKAKK